MVFYSAGKLKVKIMFNPRYGMRPGSNGSPPSLICSYSGKAFPIENSPYGGGTDRAIQQLGAWQAEYVKAKEAQAGRVLTVQELLQGGLSNRPDDRDLRQRIAESGSVQTNTEQPSADGWELRRAAELRTQWGTPDEKRANVKLAKSLEQKAKEKAEAVKYLAEEAKLEDDPKRVEAVAYCESIIKDMAYDPRVTASQHERATRNLETAKGGDLSVFWIDALALSNDRDTANSVATQVATLDIDRYKQLRDKGLPESIAAKIVAEETSKGAKVQP